jgi:acetyltransferase-like isoleucine patch superfamily enzyme
MTAPIISPNTRIRYPDQLTVGDHSVIDDFCYLSARIRIGRFCHIANNCSIAGGREFAFELGDHSSLSAGVRVWCSSNDFVRGMIALLPAELGPDEHAVKGDVIFGRLTGVGSNSVVMPDNRVPEGVAIGALSFVPASFEFEAWTVYAGVPIRAIAKRDRASVLAQLERLGPGAA